MIAAFRCNTRNGSKRSRREHDPVVVYKRVLVHLAEDVSSRYVVADLAYYLSA